MPKTMSKRIFTAALTGAIHTPSMSPYLPVTPKQLIEDAVRSYEAGAAVVHIHVRDPKTGMPNADQNVYREFCRIFTLNETKPEFEIYDAGMVNNLAVLIGRGHIKRPVYLQFVMGVLGGITPSSENLMFLLDYAKKLIGEFEFSVCVAGRAQFPICTQSVLLGGHCRVGLEDNLYLEKGQLAKSNAEQVAKMVLIIRELGSEPATPDEARQILGLKGIGAVNF
jgi:uncharacterized protein (DUF849 family)